MEDFDIVVDTIKFDLLCENRGRTLNVEKINNEEMNSICLAFLSAGWLDYLINYLSMKGFIN